MQKCAERGNTYVQKKANFSSLNDNKILVKNPCEKRLVYEKTNVSEQPHGIRCCQAQENRFATTGAWATGEAEGCCRCTPAWGSLQTASALSNTFGNDWKRFNFEACLSSIPAALPRCLYLFLAWQKCGPDETKRVKTILNTFKRPSFEQHPYKSLQHHQTVSTRDNKRL